VLARRIVEALQRSSRAAQGLLLVASALALGLARPAAAAPGERNNYYSYTDERGVLHITNAPRRGGAWKLYKSLPGSGGSKGMRRAPPSRPRVSLGAERYHRYDTLIRGASRRYQLPEPLLRAVMHTESNYNPRAVSRAGAMGLMQLMPSTARYLGVSRPFDPRQNVYGGARLLRLLANRYNGDMILVLAAYNAGARNVDKYGGIPPFAETRAYVRGVLRRYYAYERQAKLGGGTRRRGPKRHIAG
jgi:soluble lytic murein transglycosylase-like protein